MTGVHFVTQVLIDVPCIELAEELSQSQPQVQVLQDTLQQVLDRREEERQSKQLLELYLEALKKEGSIISKAAGRKGWAARKNQKGWG